MKFNLVQNQRVKIKVETEELLDTIYELDQEGLAIISIRDDRGGSGVWIFTVGQ